MATTPQTTRQENTELSLDTAALLAKEEHGVSIVGRSPWYLAWRRLRRNYVAFAFLFLFVLIVVACALAPVYAHRVAHTGPDTNHLTETVKVGDKQVPVMALNTGGHIGVTILGPTWWHAGGKFVLGADGNGRDVAVRLLYGGITSLKVGIGLPDVDWGQKIAAFVALRPGKTASAEELSDFCRQRLASFKKPEMIRFVDALPKNPLGKILKKELRSQFAE